jgi:5-methylcytosine-specific restriction endonuclease McrBC regulatory subunit McrC
LAGPVLERLAELVRQMKRGYEFVDELRQQPKGTIRWAEYAKHSVCHGMLQMVPCRYPDLGADPHLSRAIRWTVERVNRELRGVAGRDWIAADLMIKATRLLQLLQHVVSERPREEQLRHVVAGGFLGDVLRNGLQAIGWVVEERGLGGLDTSDGLAWTLSLERLWEQYVEASYREEARRTGAAVRTGEKGETTFPLRWSSGGTRSMTHLVPDLVLQKGDELQVVDAKYKAHFIRT